MILTALAALAVFASPVDDYFPMKPGTQWTYVDDNGIESTAKVDAAVDIGDGVMATPIESTQNGLNAGTLLYRVVGDTLLIVGTYKKTAQPAAQPTSQPWPVMKVGTGKMAWDFVGDLPTNVGPVAMTQHGETTMGGKRKVLDREVDTIRVKVTSTVGAGSQGTVAVDEAIYGKGIGLIEMTRTQKAGGRTEKATKKLVKFEPPQGSTP